MRKTMQNIFSRNRELLFKWAIIVFLTQIIISILPIFFNVNVVLISKIATLATYAFFALFPFFFIKKELVLFSGCAPIKAWKVGLLIGSFFSFVLWIASMLGLLANIMLSDNSNYTDHIVIIFIGSLLGSLITTAIGVLSGALAKKKNQAHTEIDT